MNLQNELIDIIEILDRKRAETWPFSALDIDLHGNILLSKVATVYYIFERVKLCVGCFFCFLPQTGKLEVIIIIICLACGSSSIGAVILIVGHSKS